MMLKAFFIVITALYLVATLFYVLRALVGKAWLSALGLRIMIVGAFLQTGTLAWHVLASRHAFLPDYNFYFQSAALLLSVIFIILCFTKNFYSSGLLFVPIINLLCIFSFTHRLPTQETLSNSATVFLVIHISCIFLTLCLFCVSMMTAIMFLLGESQIKHKKFEGIIARFPPLSTLESVHTKSLLVGLSLFTLVVLSGSLFARSTTGHFFYSHSVKQWLSVSCWVFFAFILSLRIKKIGRGHRGIVLSLLGFIGMIFLFFVGLA